MKYEGLSQPTSVRPVINESNVALSDINSKFMEAMVLALEMEKDRPAGTNKYDIIAQKKIGAELSSLVDMWRARLRLLTKGRR